MTALRELPEDIQQLIIKLPFRVGYYISASDKTGGDDADQKEMLALQNIVTFYVEDTLKSEFAQEVMLLMLKEKNHWGEWKEHIEIVPEECLKVTAALVGIVEMKEIIAFKNNLLEIAISVAQAYREFDDRVSTVEKIQTYLAIIFQRVRALLLGEEIQSTDMMLNISREERMAIGLLADTLGIEVKI
ncbi:MAG: hypothetical protein KDJ26_04135 [Alphaproteobacteria bacterium]|nr:hypothetical protein [Alphaproteobacteria bacterium]MCB1551172.1 hypothetical protein [Alphaproteobacteria bacterium]MCB9984421.1 hypothetical protein [Micavibrio sp.]HRK97814.1 hypothetical protein [Alphaproteobacteria bacterium]